MDRVTGPTPVPQGLIYSEVRRKNKLGVPGTYQVETHRPDPAAFRGYEGLLHYLPTPADSILSSPPTPTEQTPGGDLRLMSTLQEAFERCRNEVERGFVPGEGETGLLRALNQLLTNQRSIEARVTGASRN